MEKRIKQNCVVCSRGFSISQCRVGHIKTCSKNCSRVKQSLERKGKTRQQVEVVCKVCDKHFFVSRSRLTKIVTCSKECKSKRMAVIGHSKKGIPHYGGRGEKHWAWGKHNRKKFYCLDCKKEITPQADRCRPCSFLARRKDNLDIKDTDKYRYEHLQRTKFRTRMQRMIFERDNYTCQMCGTRGVDLQVDHIQSWAEYVDLRFSIDNCRTLCAKCHYFITFGKKMPEEIKSWGHNFLTRGEVCLP